MQRILLVEDSLEIQTIVKALFQNRFETSVAADLKTARKKLVAEPFDLILLDLGLPDGSGFGLLAELNAKLGNDSTPVFFLTSSSDDHSKLQAFQLGAEDYILKPFSHLELRARVEARLRRAKITNVDVLQWGNLQLSMNTQRVALSDDTNNQTVFDLSPLEFKLLAHLMRHHDHVLSREQIMSAVWGDHVQVLDRTVDAHVSRLRRKLAASEYNVVTVVGSGYAFRKVQKTSAKLAA